MIELTTNSLQGIIEVCVENCHILLNCKKSGHTAYYSNLFNDIPLFLAFFDTHL